ncbi:MAG: N-acyl homoserine lactonase family protein [Anaerolineae bacterium]
MKIHALQTGQVAIKQNQRQGVSAGLGRLANTLLDSHWTPMLPILVWVIEHPEGLIVVDVGETARVAQPGYFPRWHPFLQLCNRMDVKPDDEIGPSMKRMGLSPDDVRWVVMTHMHTDHAGGLHHFPKAEILISRQEYAATRGFGGLVSGYLNQRFPTWLNPRLIDFEARPYENFPQSLPLTKAGDVQLVSTVGHSVGHMSVIAREGDRSYFLAGDTSYTEDFMLRQVVDGVSPDEHAARQTLRHVFDYTQQHPTVYLPSHDPDSVTRLERGQVVAAVATTL